MYQKDFWEREQVEARRLPSHPAVAAYVLPKIAEIRRYIPLTERTTLLDVGCGNGFFTFYFEKICDTCGVDYSERMLRRNPARRKCLMDANRLSFRADAFDVVFCHSLLHHVADPEGVIREMRRVARKHVVILEPNRANPLMFMFLLLVKEERKALSLSIRHLRRMVSGSGLEIIASFAHGAIVPNRWPRPLIPLGRLGDFRQPLGMTAFVIAEK